MQTTLRVSMDTRDALSRIAAEELGGVSVEETLRVLLFEHQTAVALARLASEPEALAAYQDEARQLAETDVEVSGW